MSSDVLITKKTQLVDANGADLSITQEQFDRMAYDKSLERTKEIQKNFADFCRSPIPDFSNYRFLFGQVVVRMFTYTESYSILMTSPRRTFFPIGRVVAVADGVEYKVGDFVKLKDFEATEIVNPDYELWEKNALDKGTMKKIGSAPPARINNFMVVHGRKLFNTNPIVSDVNLESVDTFVMTSPNIECIVLDPLKLIGNG